MAQRTISPTVIDIPSTVVTFIEGDFPSANYIFEGTFISLDGSFIPVIPDTMITAKTVSGFTFVVDMAGTLQGIASDYGSAEIDPDVEEYAIVTLAQIKSYLNIPAATTTNDPFLIFWINMVSDWLERKTNGKIALQSITGQIIDGNGSYKIGVPYPPLYQVGTTSPTTLADIQFRDDPESSWENLVESSIANILISSIPREKNWIKLYDKKFPLGTENVKLNYKSGYLVIPGIFIRIVIEMVASIFEESIRGDDVFGSSSRSFSQTGASISESGGTSGSSLTLSGDHALMLEPYVWKGLGLYR